jgi:hypothetical protein
MKFIICNAQQILIPTYLKSMKIFFGFPLPVAWLFNGLSPGSLFLTWRTGCLPPSASFIVYSLTSFLFSRSTLFAGVAILGPHFYTILGFGVDLFFGLVIFFVFTGGHWFLVLTDATTYVSSLLHSPLTPPFRCDDEVECI